MSHSGSGFTKGLLIGSIVGAGVALLYAPKSGEQLRHDMSSKANGLKTDVGRYMKRLRKSSDEMLDKARETVEAAAEAVTGGNGARESVRAIKEATSKVRTH